MAEKRFEEDYNDCGLNQYDYSTLQSRYEANIERNEIIEWNKHSDNAQYKDLERIVDLLNFKEMNLENCRKRYEELHKENMELKKENMEYYRLINCGNCKYHNYDWYDDGEEFEVCDKGNTERMIYNRFCKDWKRS